MNSEDELVRFKKFLLRMPATHNFKYTGAARTELTTTLNSILNLSEIQLRIDDSNHNHYNRSCGRRFARGESCYRCLTCGYDETCALCPYCFQKEKHLGHEIHKSIVQRDNAGICDCGDLVAYPESNCTHYLTPLNNDSFPDLTEDSLRHIADALGIMIDYVIDVMYNSYPCIIPAQTADDILLSLEYSTLDVDRYLGYDMPSGKYGLVLYSDQVHQYKDAVQRIKTVTRKVTEFAEMIATRCNTHGRAVVMVSDSISQLIKKQELLTATGLSACIRSTRDIFREEMCDDIISWYLDFSSSNIAKNINEVRSTIVKVMFMAYNRGCTVPSSDIFFKDDLLINPRSLFRTRSQQMAKTNGEWDFPNKFKALVGYPDSDLDAESSNFIGSRFQFLLLFDIRFCKTPREKLHCIYIPVMDQAFEFSGLMVAQFMDIYEDILTLFLIVDREPEFSVMPILSTQIFTSPQNDSLILKHGDVLKMIKLMYNYVTTFKTQNTLSTYPKNGVIFSTLKNRKWAHVLLDLSYIITRNPDIENIFNFFFCFPEYVHFLAVFQSKPIFKREAKEHVEYENQDYSVFFNALTVISLFSESISKVLNKIPKDRLLSQGNPMDVLYHSYTTKVKKSFTETLYTIIVRKIIELLFMDASPQVDVEGMRLIVDKEDPIEFEKSQYIDASVVKHNVLEDKVSFLHPLHSMFSWLVEMDASMDNDRTFFHLMDMIQGEYEFYLKERGGISGPGKLATGTYEGILAFFDIPIKKLVMISQIKIGLWVRNGTSVRTQMNLYRYSGGREFGYTRDLFLTQMFVAFFPDMNHAIWSVLNRWLLDDWAAGKRKSEFYNKLQLQAMLEEFMLFLIHILTADLHLHKMDAVSVKDELIRREIIHALCFSKLSFSAIDAAIPEHISSTRRFPVVFEQCVDELENKGEGNDIVKRYKLKKELISKINPYYVHYSRNKTDECISATKERIHKKTEIEKSQIVIEPVFIDWSDSPFERITDILTNDILLNFVLQTLKYCIEELTCSEDEAHEQKIEEGEEGKLEAEKGNCDSLLDLTLHFTHIIAKHRNWCGIEKTPVVSIIQYLILLSKEEAAYVFKPKAINIIKEFNILFQNAHCNLNSFVPEFDEEIFDVSINTIGKSNNKWENDPGYKKKKKLAKRKKAKLLAKLKRQQDKFAEQFINSDATSQGSDINLENNELAESVSDIKMETSDTNDSTSESWEFPDQTCILCHMPSANENEVFGVFGYITESNQFRYVPYNNHYWFLKAFGGKSSLDDDHKYIHKALAKFVEDIERQAVVGPGFPITEDPLSQLSFVDNQSVFTSCGHGMHYQCYEHYYETSKAKQLSQITRTIPENVERREFFCPLCKAINNIFIPVYYTKIDDKLNEQFREQISLDQLTDAKLDVDLIKQPLILDMVTVEFMNATKTKMKAKDWFMQSEIMDGTLTYNVNSSCSAPEALKNCMKTLFTLSPPFDTVSSLICKTIESIEISLRGQPYEAGKCKLIISQISNNTLISLRIWMQLRDMLRCIHGRAQEDRLRVLSETSIGILENLINEDELTYNGQDFFLLLTMCDESKCLNFNYQKLVGIALIKHVKQSLMYAVLILLKKSQLDDTIIDLNWFASEKYSGDVSQLLGIIGAFSGSNFSVDSLDGVYSMVIKLVTPFLRKCLILAYAKYAVLSTDEDLEIDDSLNECDKICQVMNIPKVENIINSFKIEDFNDISEADKGKLVRSRVPYPGMIELINLPIRLSDFFTEYYNKKDGVERPTDPAICFYCGAMVDLQANQYGDEYGACNMHIRWECIDGGRGMFFLPRNNCVLLLDNSKGSFIPSPYNDDYGECDEDSKKGHEVCLTQKKYKDMQMRVWMTHNIQNVIAKKFESLSDVGGWDTL